MLQFIVDFSLERSTKLNRLGGNIMRNLFFLFFAVFFLQGCSTIKTAQITTGMDKAQVINTWGEPRSIQTAKNSAQRDAITEKWYYYNQKVGKTKLPEKCVIFKDGKTAYSFIF